MLLIGPPINTPCPHPFLSLLTIVATTAITTTTTTITNYATTDRDNFAIAVFLCTAVFLRQAQNTEWTEDVNDMELRPF